MQKRRLPVTVTGALGVCGNSRWWKQRGGHRPHVHATEGAVASQGTDLMNPTSVHIPTVAMGPFQREGTEDRKLYQRILVLLSHEHWSIGIAIAIMSFPTSHWLSILWLELWFSMLPCDWVGPLRVTKFNNKDHISAMFKRLPIPLEWNAKSLPESNVIRHLPSSLISSFIIFPFAFCIPTTLVPLLFLLHARHVPTF